MLVDAHGTVGTIGGGHLEWHATTVAREQLLDSIAAPVRIADLILGPQLGQCCGGRVELWLERLTRDDLPWLTEAARRMRARRGLSLATEFAHGVVSRRLLRSVGNARGLELRRTARAHVLFEALRPQRPQLWIFGAGHVGQALVRLLAELALFEITWIDSRPELLPAGLPEDVTAKTCAAPADLVGSAPAGARFVVMTHDHALDYELCRLILTRADASWLGLIGSASKAARFRSRLLRDGGDRAMLSGLTCPIGIPGVTSKLPAAIAIAIAAQLLQRPAVPAAHAADSHGCSGSCGSCGSERRKAT
jgi:xanthine dehydrogenase accessory factor